MSHEIDFFPLKSQSLSLIETSKSNMASILRHHHKTDTKKLFNLDSLVLFIRKCGHYGTILINTVGGNFRNDIARIFYLFYYAAQS